MTDPLGDRMKLYELAEAGRKLMPLLPVLARIDGRAFHASTARHAASVRTGALAGNDRNPVALVGETNNAYIGYMQSDSCSITGADDAGNTIPDMKLTICPYCL